MSSQVRQTSVEAYWKVVPFLGEMQEQVYRCLWHNGPMTGNEVDVALSPPGKVNPSYHKRLSELEKRGVVLIAGTRKCRVSDENCQIWDVTDATTVNPIDTKSHKQKLIDIIREITRDWCCCCTPGYTRKCWYCRAQDAIENR